MYNHPLVGDSVSINLPGKSPENLNAERKSSQTQNERCSLSIFRIAFGCEFREQKIAGLENGREGHGPIPISAYPPLAVLPDSPASFRKVRTAFRTVRPIGLWKDAGAWLKSSCRAQQNGCFSSIERREVQKTN